jgi:hypothetical protein
VINGNKEVLMFNKGANLGDLMNNAHGVTTKTPTQAKPKGETTTMINFVNKIHDKVKE